MRKDKLAATSMVRFGGFCKPSKKRDLSALFLQIEITTVAEVQLVLRRRGIKAEN
jgi:hypothetical protein